MAKTVEAITSEYETNRTSGGMGGQREHWVSRRISNSP